MVVDPPLELGVIPNGNFHGLSVHFAKQACLEKLTELKWILLMINHDATKVIFKKISHEH